MRKTKILKIMSIGFIVLMFALVFGNMSVPTLAQDQELIVTQWRDSEGRSPMNYTYWRSNLPGTVPPYTLTLVFSQGVSGCPTILLIVNQSIFSSIQTVLLQTYVPDLVMEGYYVFCYTWTGNRSNPIPLKTDLCNIYMSQHFEGMVFIGDLPVAWYENYNDFFGLYAEFPTDLYWMDLNGDWTDNDGNGKFDLHTNGTGDTAPEVYMGRLTASPLSGNEISLLTTYFQKNHNYRIGTLSTRRRALMYIDDTWATMGLSYLGVPNAYPLWDLINLPAHTSAVDYHNRIHFGYELIHLMCHSSSFQHIFYIPGGWEHFDNYEIPIEDPEAIFYNLYACSNTRYIENNYMGGKYIFDTTLGLAAVGSTKIGGMMDFFRFYTPFGNYESIGQSFLEWFQAMAYIPDAIMWFYGMTLLGDPTLRKTSTGPPLIGGVAIPVDKSGLLAPYIGLASTILVATVATSIYAKHVKRRKERQ